MGSLRVKPAPGKQARFQDHPFPLLPEGGALVPDTPYWRRRLVCGDVTFCAEPKPAPKSTKQNKEG